MKYYGIARNSTIILNLRLRGGASGFKNPNGSISFKDAMKRKAPITMDHIQNMSRHYIVEQMKKYPTMQVKNIEVNFIFLFLQSKAIICKFNGFWPRYEDLR